MIQRTTSIYTYIVQIVYMSNVNQFIILYDYISLLIVNDYLTFDNVELHRSVAHLNYGNYFSIWFCFKIL